MFERFDERARRVVVVAQEQARRLRHSYIGTEHLLLALVGDPDSIATKVLVEMGVTPASAEAAVTEMIGLARPIRRPHAVHASRRRCWSSRCGSAAPRSSEHRCRAHPARHHPRRQWRRRPGPRGSRVALSELRERVVGSLTGAPHLRDAATLERTREVIERTGGSVPDGRLHPGLGGVGVALDRLLSRLRTEFASAFGGAGCASRRWLRHGGEEALNRRAAPPICEKSLVRG